VTNLNELAARDADARRPKPIEQRVESVAPMSDDLWESLAIDDLTEDEADLFWQAIAG
jgi:hypothetical protein